MVKYYFEDKEKRQELKRILDEWLGTPFRHQCGVKGLGCDCIHLVLRIFEELGILKRVRVKVPDYPRDWHLHNTREILKEGIGNHLDVESWDVSGGNLSKVGILFDGDIILSHYGQAASHAGIYCQGYIYQSIVGVGVRKINLNEPTFKKRFKYAFRVRG